MKLKSYVYGEWIEGNDNGVPLFNAINGEEIFRISSKGIDFKSVIDYAKSKGKHISQYTFHERAVMLKKLALYLLEKKKKYYKPPAVTGNVAEPGENKSIIQVQPVPLQPPDAALY